MRNKITPETILALRRQLRALKEQEAMTYRQFAREIGISKTVLHVFLSGHMDPTSRTLAKILAYLSTL